MLAGREVPDAVEAWAHHSGSESGLPSPILQPLLVHFPQMIQKVNEFSIRQKEIEKKKSFSGGCGISGLALVVKNLPAVQVDVRDSGSIPGSGRSPGGGHGKPRQYCCLENPMDRGVWQVTVYGVAKSQT